MCEVLLIVQCKVPFDTERLPTSSHSISNLILCPTYLVIETSSYLGLFIEKSLFGIFERYGFPVL